MNLFGKAKEALRPLTMDSPTFEKIWLVCQWVVVDLRYIFFSDYAFNVRDYNKRMKTKEGIAKPRTYNQMLMFLKLADRNPLITECSDKHLVRGYVERCGYSDILKNEYTTFSKTSDIDFDALPSPCYLKRNNGSGHNCVFRKEDRNFNRKHWLWKFSFLLKKNPYELSREWGYKNVEPLILCEELLTMPDPKQQIPELQFFCFDGEPKFIMYNLGLADEKGRHVDAIRWALWMDFSSADSLKRMNPEGDPPPKPKNYDKMIEVARALSNPFKQVRVDLFNIEGKIYFNELTFYSGGGFTMVRTPEIQNGAMEWCDISDYTIASDAYEKGVKRLVALKRLHEQKD